MGGWAWRAGLLAAATTMGGAADAALTVRAQYNLRGAGGIRDTAAPETLACAVGLGPTLARRGSPRVMSDGPASRHAVYDSCVKFEADDQCYQGPAPLAQGDNWVLETWVRATRAEDPGYHAAVANGHGGIGFLIAQHGGQWEVLVGGIGGTPLAPVKPDTWTHLAVVQSGGQASGWVDGRRVSRLPAIGGAAPNFAVGATSPGKEPFHGWVAEVRYSTFAPGRFDPAADFLLDNERLRQVAAAELAARARLVGHLRATPGVTTVARLDERPTADDWLIRPVTTPSTVQLLPEDQDQRARIMLSNGLVSRTFLVADGNLACFSLRRADHDIEFVRALKPELRLRLDNGGWTEVGGLTGAPDHAFLTPRWYAGLEARPDAWKLTGMAVGPCVKPYDWQPKCNAPANIPWPARGRRVTFTFASPDGELLADVHYEIYDGLPVISKTFSLRNRTAREVVLTQFEGEHLAVAPTTSKLLHVESDYSFATANFTDRCSALGIHAGGNNGQYRDYYLGGGTTRFIRDPDWGSMATLNPAEDLFLGDPENALLLSRPTVGPAWLIRPGETFDGFRTFEILNDSTEEERQFLAQRRFYRTLAPQTNEKMLEVHAPVTRDMKVLGPLMDQMAELGFEQLQAPEHPGGFNYADTSPANIAAMKAICDYGRAKGIRVGAYQLMMASQGWGSREDNYNCIDPSTGQPGSLFGQSACGASAWADMYYRGMWQTIEQAGMGAFKPDGPYHGDPCAATDHPHHRGLADSQWAQWKWMCSVLAEGQRRGLYLTVPDYYFLNGQVCTGMGYREATDNIDIVLQTLIYRQYIYDGTWHKTPGMGWVNLNTEVLRGGLEANVDRYERALIVLLSSGAQVWVRGHRLYDGPRSQAMLTRWMAWYKRHREVLGGDIIHLRRPDGRGLDYYLHVNPAGREKGLLLVFNPTDEAITQSLSVPLYYTGLSDTAKISAQDGPAKSYRLDRGRQVRLPVTVPAGGFGWWVVR
ncbi:MAG: LamG domain-containing protein [Armatimonadetes bacterium]|nr:LamG domain-containing protein [Armatimonadota bacterium]